MEQDCEWEEASEHTKHLVNKVIQTHAVNGNDILLSNSGEQCSLDETAGYISTGNTHTASLLGTANSLME